MASHRTEKKENILTRKRHTHTQSEWLCPFSLVHCQRDKRQTFSSLLVQCRRYELSPMILFSSCVFVCVCMCILHE